MAFPRPLDEDGHESEPVENLAKRVRAASGSSRNKDAIALEIGVSIVERLEWVAQQLQRIADELDSEEDDVPDDERSSVEKIIKILAKGESR